MRSLPEHAARPLTLQQRDGMASILTQKLVQRRAQRALRLGQVSTVDHALEERQQDTDAPERRDGDLEVSDALSARDAEELAELVAALARIERGNYGICLRCGAPIGIDRLRAQPEASRCAGCEALEEGGQDRLDLS